MNQTSGGNHWLELKLEGTRSNRDAVGARVKVVSRGGVQYGHVSSAAGYASSSAGPLHFGLGPDPAAELIEVQWPSGSVQQVKSSPADRVLTIREVPAR